MVPSDVPSSPAMSGARRVGVLLLNLGTPDSPGVSDVRRYLREFLWDARVIDLSPLGRWLLLNLIILPFRPRRSAEAYRAIWSDGGSPLLVHGRALREEVAGRLGARFEVVLAMRYGAPSIEAGLAALERADVSRILVLPLFPQYASATTGSAIERVYALAARAWNVPVIEVLGEFYDDPRFIEAFAAVARPVIAELRADHVLFSYHGLPERHLARADSSGGHCLATPACCDTIGPINRRCYRAQSIATTRALAAALSLPEGGFSSSFQSRLGRTPWIQPYTDRVLPELAKQGKRRLAVVCPAFVADCLETLEEIGIRAREQWRELGGEELVLVPSLNAHPAWADAVAAMIRERTLALEPGASPAGGQRDAGAPAR